MELRLESPIKSAFTFPFSAKIDKELRKKLVRIIFA